MKLPYVQEINEYQETAHKYGEPLIIQEWDNEYAPEVLERLLDHIKRDPDRPHVAPYLTNIYHAVDGTPILFWAHRLLKEEVQVLTVEEKFTKINKTVTATLRYPAWVAGGEPEADIVCLGFTYLPYQWWVKIYPEIKDLPWNILDIEISARMLRDGMKARIHWDCVVNHLHIDIRPREKSVFRKWIGIDKAPLTDEEKKWLKVDKLPRYHGFLTEPMLADKETRNLICPKCGVLNTWKQLLENETRCLKCGRQYPSSLLYGEVNG